MKPIYYILFSLGILSFASCSHEYGYETEITNPAEGKTIEFTLSNSTEVATRGGEELWHNEGVIKSLDIFFVDSEGDVMYYPTESQLSFAKGAGPGKVTITIPETIYEDSLLDEECTIYLLANTTTSRDVLEGRDTLADIKNIEESNPSSRLFNVADAPEAFLMTGETTVRMEGAPSQNLGKITLRRTAAKVVVNIANASIYEVGEDGERTETVTHIAEKATVRITNYLDVAKIGGNNSGDDYLYEAEAGHYPEAAHVVMTPTTSEGAPQAVFAMQDAEGKPIAFYSYPNDWSRDIHKETYITLEVYWREIGGATRPYYYRIPFSYIDAGVEKADFHNNKIRSNYVYEFMVDISALGGVDPAHAVNVKSNFNIIDWNDKTVDVSILEYHYLFVNNPIMRTYRDEFEWEYASSLPIAADDIEIIEATSIVFTDERGNTYPQGRTIDYLAEGPRPTLSTRTEGDKTFFSVKAWIPNNYVPLNIKLRVNLDLQQSFANLSANVALTILPGEYVTASNSNGGENNSDAYPWAGAYNHPINNPTRQNEYGDGDYGSNNPDGQTGQMNFNFYQINITSIPDQEIWIGGVWRKLLIGDPTMVSQGPSTAGQNDWTHINGFEYIETDPNKNHIVSPSFVVASQRGITATNRTWAQGQERCRRYRESQYPAGTWRAPTFAELAMLAVMQNDPNSAIKGLFQSGDGYWFTALEAYRIQASTYSYSYNGTGTAVVNNGTSSIRCVRDTWKVYSQDSYGVYGEN